MMCPTVETCDRPSIRGEGVWHIRADAQSSATDQLDDGSPCTSRSEVNPSKARRSRSAVGALS